MTAGRRYFAGRAFETSRVHCDVPQWAPLEAIASLARSHPDLASFHEGEFMFMGTVRNVRKKLAIHLYKHYDTRRYLNLDDAGHAYAYRPPLTLDVADRSSGGRYQRLRTLVSAIERLELDRFEDDRPLSRSFPPARWPCEKRDRPFCICITERKSDILPP